MKETQTDAQFAQMKRETISRLSDSIAVLGSRSMINLALGMVLSLLAICALFFFVINQGTFETTLEFASHFIPRLTIVFFVEVVAFFFLRLYRNGLSDIKYYQNEITNCENMYTALIAAIYLEDQASYRKAIGTFAQTERNFILTKGQSTVEIERTKVELQNEKLLSDVIERMLNRNGEKNGKPRSLKKKTKETNSNDVA